MIWYHGMRWTTVVDWRKNDESIGVRYRERDLELVDGSKRYDRKVQLRWRPG